MSGNDAGTAAASPVSSPDSKGGAGLPQSFNDLKGKSRETRGVKPGTKRGPYRKPHAPEEAGPETPEIFTPENTRLVVALPFNLAAIQTGFEGFLLSEGEASMLSNLGAGTLNQWVRIDPKYLSLIMFSFALITLTGEKLLLYRRALRIEAENRATKAPPADAPAPAAPAAVTP